MGVGSLRDIDLKRVTELSGELRRRVRHVVTENARTVSAAEAMQRGDAAELGRLMRASHESLRDDYEVSGPELDTIVDIASATDGCLGARMTRGGFAGCAVALVTASAAASFAENVSAKFVAATSTTPTIWLVRPHDGASIEVMERTQDDV